MTRLFALGLTLALALPAAGQNLLSEVTGNWAGASNQGFYFRAQLTPNDDKVRLMIWNGTDTVPAASAGSGFDNDQIALGAFATRQELEVFETPDGNTLQIVTEFADEEASGRTVLQIQFLDNQFTVTGFFLSEVHYVPDGEPETYECDVDLWRGMATVNGIQRQLEPMPFEALNASDWTFSAAFDRGYCPRS